MDDLRDKNTTDKQPNNSEEHLVLSLSPDFIKSEIGETVRNLYPSVTFIEESDKTLVPSGENTSMPASSTLIDENDYVDAGDPSTSNVNNRKRSHMTINDLEKVPPAQRVARKDMSKVRTKMKQANKRLTDEEAPSEPAKKKKKLPTANKSTTTELDSIKWMQFSRGTLIPELCGANIFSKSVKELKTQESDQNILRKLVSKAEFVRSDETLNTILSVEEFKEKISERLVNEEPEKLLQKIPCNRIWKYVTEKFTPVMKDSTQSKSEEH